MKKKKRVWMILLGVIILVFASYFLAGSEKIDLNDKTRATLPGQFAPLSVGVTHYEYSGDPDQPLAVLIHGFSVPYFVYDNTVQDLVDSGFSVLRYDLYGRGYSDRPDVDYDLALYVNQLQDLLTYLDVQQPLHIVGLSQGAPVAGAFANQNTERVSSLTLIDPLITQVSNKDILPMGLSLIGEYITKVILVPYILPGAQADDLHHPENYPGWEAKYREQLQYRGFTRAILSSIRHLPEMDPISEYQLAASAGIPIQLIWGRHDKTIPYSDVEQLINAIPAAELHIIEDAGHIPHVEHPEVVNPILVAFFNANGG